MIKKQGKDNETVWGRTKSYINENDIRSLVFIPILIGAGLIGLGFLFALITGEPLKPPLNYLIIGIGSLIFSLGGIAEIIKKEMPGPFGQIVRGFAAVFSGALMLLFFGGLGIIIIAFAFSIK